MPTSADRHPLSCRTTTGVRVAVLLVAVCSCAAVSSHADLKPQNLKCEWRSNPLGIDVTQPRFSWTLKATDAAERGMKQRAYQVLVASSLQALASNEGNQWDRGKVPSAEMFQIAYAGKALAPAIRYFWKARVWDARDRPSAWSDLAEFTTSFQRGVVKVPADLRVPQCRMLFPAPPAARPLKLSQTAEAAARANHPSVPA